MNLFNREPVDDAMDAYERSVMEAERVCSCLEHEDCTCANGVAMEEVYGEAMH